MNLLKIAAAIVRNTRRVPVLLVSRHRMRTVFAGAAQAPALQVLSSAVPGTLTGIWYLLLGSMAAFGDILATTLTTSVFWQPSTMCRGVLLPCVCMFMCVCVHV